MSSKPLPHVHRFRDRHGHVRHYFRKPGLARVALTGVPGSPEYLTAYKAALRGLSAPIGAARTVPGTMNALIVGYYGSADFAQLAKVTRDTYRNLIERFRGEHGDKPAAQLQRKHVLRMMDARRDTPAAANALLKILRILMRFAIDRGIRPDDPTQTVRRIRYATDGFRGWLEPDIERFEAYHPSGSRARLAFALLLYTGQRPGDVIRMGRQHVQGGALTVTQSKTGTRLTVPLHAALQAELAHVDAGRLTFVVTLAGAPFTAAGFSHWFGDRARESGVTDGCTAHGLRKAAARRLAEAGCTAHQIASITGHRTLKEVERYTRAADQTRLAVTAMATIKAKEPRTK